MLLASLLVASPPSPLVSSTRRSWSTVTVSSSFTSTSLTTPAAGDTTATSILSVSIDASSWSRSTESPTGGYVNDELETKESGLHKRSVVYVPLGSCLMVPSLIDSAIVGTLTVIAAV